MVDMLSLGNILALSFNLLLWLLTYWYVQKKFGKWSIGTIIILLYTLISICCFYVYFSVNAFGYFDKELYVIPFLYLYFMILITTRPLFNYSPRYADALSIPCSKILNITCVVFSTLACLTLINSIGHLREGLISILIDSSNAADLYSTSTYNRMNQSASVGYNIFAILGNISLSLIPFLFYCYLLQRKKSKIILILLIISLLITPLNGIANASRLSVVTSGLIFALLYFFFKPYLGVNISRIFKKCVSIIAILFASLFLIITIGRSSVASSDSSIIYGFARYFAESPLVFQTCMDAGGTRKGEYTFAFQHIFDRASQPNEAELRLRFSNLKVDSSRFYTYVGDFVLDYGPLIAAIIFIFIFFLVYNKTIVYNRCISFPQLLLLYILIELTSGFYQYQFSMKMGNANLCTLILLYFGFGLCSNIMPNWFTRVYKV